VAALSYRANWILFDPQIASDYVSLAVLEILSQLSPLSLRELRNATKRARYKVSRLAAHAHATIESEPLHTPKVDSTQARDAIEQLKQLLAEKLSISELVLFEKLIDGSSQQDIAKTLGISQASFYSTRSRLVRKIREIVSRLDIDI
jgi:DNA-directed RNA polymerase specialized sigma24 family protein